MSESQLEAQYRALLDSAVLLEDVDRVVIRVVGEKADEMLHGLVTNEVKDLPAGRGAYAFMLTPKGRPVAEMRLLRLDGEFWMDIPAACAPGALAHLKKYLPPNFATFEEAPLRRLAVVGPRAAEAIDAWTEQQVAHDLVPLQLATLDVGAESAVMVGREAIEGPGLDVYVSDDSAVAVRSALERSVREVGGRPAGADLWNVRRVERGLPAYGVDFDQAYLSQELGQDDRAISFEKGCYTGQEVVARIHFRGHVNRILRGFALPGPVEPGPLYEGVRERGLLTSPVISPRYGAIALGFARAEIQPGSLLSREAGGEPDVQVRELPFDPPGDPSAA